MSRSDYSAQPIPPALLPRLIAAIEALDDEPAHPNDCPVCRLLHDAGLEQEAHGPRPVGRPERGLLAAVARRRERRRADRREPAGAGTPNAP